MPPASHTATMVPTMPLGCSPATRAVRPVRDCRARQPPLETLLFLLIVVTTPLALSPDQGAGDHQHGLTLLWGELQKQGADVLEELALLGRYGGWKAIAVHGVLGRHRGPP